MTRAAGKSAEGEVSAATLAEQFAAPDPAKSVPIETVQAMLAERNVHLATMSEERARERVEVATRKGCLSPAMKDWALALCQSDEASFDAFIGKATPAYGHLFSVSHLRHVPSGARKAVAVSAEAAVIAAQLGIEPSRLAD